MLCGLTAPSRGTVRVLGGDPRDDLALMPPHRARAPAGGRVRGADRAASSSGWPPSLHGLPDPGQAAAAALERRRARPGRPAPAHHLLEGHAPAGQGGPGARARSRRPRARRAAHRPRPAPAAAHDRAVPAPRATTGKCVVVSSHVLDEVERFGSRVLVIAQGRLAAEGDFHAIRDLMDDRPHRIRVRTDGARALAARGCSDVGGAVGVRLDRRRRAASSTPIDVVAFRRDGRRGRASSRRPPRRGRAPRRRPRERLPLPGGSAVTTSTTPPAGLGIRVWAPLYSLVLRTQATRGRLISLGPPRSRRRAGRASPSASADLESITATDAGASTSSTPSA